jgi:hypothetical protein
MLSQRQRLRHDLCSGASVVCYLRQPTGVNLTTELNNFCLTLCSIIFNFEKS